MSKILGVNRSTIYYKSKPKKVDTALENAVIKEFYNSRENYGTRKLKIVLNRRKFVVSRRRIGKIMSKYSLVSKYTIRNTKKKSNGVNNNEVSNIVNREFDNRKKYDVVILSFAVV